MIYIVVSYCFAFLFSFDISIFRYLDMSVFRYVGPPFDISIYRFIDISVPLRYLDISVLYLPRPAALRITAATPELLPGINPFLRNPFDHRLPAFGA